MNNLDPIIIALPQLFLKDESAKCIYHLTNDCYIWSKNGKTYMKPCTSIRCWKHSPIKRGEYAQRINDVLPKYEYKYFLMLPIGRLLQKLDFRKLWESFKRSIKRIMPEFRYIMFKELQNNNFHLHGVLASMEELDMTKIKLAWIKFEKKHLEKVHRTEDITCEQSETDIGTSKYITKDLIDPKGCQVIPRSICRRVVLLSNDFFAPQFHCI